MKKAISLVLIQVLGMVSVSPTAEDTWTRKADMPTARSCHSTSVVNGKIYAIGGMRNANSGPLSVVEEYNPETDTWTTKSNMPIAKQSHGACAVEGKIYVIGGGQSVLGAGSSTVQQYDPEIDTWTRKANMPTARFVLSASAVNGKIYAIGGKPAHGVSPLKTVEEYDPAIDTWTTKAGMQTARYGLCTCVVNGRIYAIGGDPGSYVGLRTVEEYDPITDTWTRKADMLSPRAFLSVSALGGRIYAIGGVPSLTGAPLSIVDEYDPATNTWIRKSDMPTPILLLSSIAVNSQIYVIGGADKPYPSWQACSTVEEYDPNPLVVDFNGDGIVDSVDICMMIDYWGTDDSSYDIAPPPFGDGIVDVQDLIVLAEHLFEGAGLVAHWALDETAGDIAYDSAGNINATVYNGQWSAGKVDGALDFNGLTTYMDCGDSLRFGTQKMTLAMWLEPEHMGGMRYVLSRAREGADDFDYVLMRHYEDQVEFAVAQEGSEPVSVMSNATTPLDEWTHVAVCLDGSEVTIYINGQLDASAGYGHRIICDGCRLWISSLGGDTRFYNGKIDDIKIYNVALSAGQIEDLAR